MTYEQIKNLSEKEFKRFCGVKPQLFEEMVCVLRQKAPESGVCLATEKFWSVRKN